MIRSMPTLSNSPISRATLACFACAGFVNLAILAAHAQTRSPGRSGGAPAHALGNLDDALLEWPLPPGEERYGVINGRRLHEYVVEQAAISRRYRDQGHPKFWGRIIGASSDAQDADWLAAKFKETGLSGVRIQSLDLVPQWMPQSWNVSLISDGKTIDIESAQPDYGATGTPPEGLDLQQSTSARVARRISRERTFAARRSSHSTCSV